MTRTVWTFPGQLTEYVGMTRGLLEDAPALRRNLELASDLIGEDLARICERGPEALLHRDDVAAAAVVAVGASSAEELQRRGFRPDAILGYSLGIYTAAAAAGAISLEDALGIVLTVAAEGDRVFPPGRMTMGFVTGIRLPRLEASLAGALGAGDIAITNVNTPAQIVLAGGISEIEAALASLRPEAMRCDRLQIARPYHSRWMAPVASSVRGICRTMKVVPPVVPLHDHRDGGRLDDPEVVRERLSAQLETRLDWTASVRRLVAEGATLFVEMPPGSSTTRMVRWIDRDAAALALDESRDRARFLAGAAAAGPAGGGQGSEVP